MDAWYESQMRVAKTGFTIANLKRSRTRMKIATLYEDLYSF